MRSPLSSWICPEPWICDPRDHRCGEGGAARLDFAARVVGLEPPAVQAAAQPQAAKLRVLARKVHHDEVVGQAEHRAREARTAAAAAFEHRLVIAGNLPFAHSVRRNHRIGGKRALDECACHIVVARGQRARFRAGCLHRQRIRAVAAAADECAHARSGGRAVPAGQIGEVHRLVACLGGRRRLRRAGAGAGRHLRAARRQ
jgi:hypothetical protein